jgi:hypothetical protein
MTAIGSFWRTDRGLTALLLFLFLTLLVAPPLLSSGIISPFLFDVLFSLVLLSGASVVSTRRWPAILALALAALTLAVRWMRLGPHARSLDTIDPALTALSFLTLAGLVLFQVLRKGPITLYRVQGAIAAYMLLGLAWAGAYELVSQVAPGSFRLADGKAEPMSLLYYSFVTLTTVGYGDVTPVLPAARSLAMAEALVGQLFPAVLIARLVSMELAARARPDGA